MDSPVLSRRLTRTARAVAEALFATSEGPPPGGEVDAVVGAFSAFLAAAGPGTARLYRWMLRLAGLVAPLLVLRLPGLARLPLGLRIRALARLEESPLAAVVWGLKAILCTAYWEAPGPAHAIGYDARCLLEEAGAHAEQGAEA